ncbi:MAG: hypothetical protein HZA14_13275 [Nitrospirae bacterium]|nr:hypothetical protein [Nitrospirota bacterium]
MKIARQRKSNPVFFLAAAIAALCAGFIFLNCGNHPQQKVPAANAGSFALDCSQSPDGSCGAYASDAKILYHAGINNKEFTAEAWIKRKTDGIFNGGIFSRFSLSGGLSSYVKNNQPRFVVKVGSVYYKVSANVDLSKNEWTHVAGVLVNEDHSNIHGACQFAESFSTSIKIDSSKKPHIAYYNGHLKYAAKNTSGAWGTSIIESISKNIDVGSYPALALDSSDKAYISYYDPTNKTLKYATNASGSWARAIVAVAEGGDVGKYSSISAEPTKRSGEDNNRLYISYYNAAGILKYAKYAGTGTPAVWSWQSENADNSGGDVGQYTSIALDSNKNAYISYYDATNGNLKYATNASGLWAQTTVGSSGDVGQYTSLMPLEAISKSPAFGETGYGSTYSGTGIHIGYYDANGILKYARATSGFTRTGGATTTPSTLNPEPTTLTEVDNSAGVDVGKYASAVKDSSNKIYISYYDDTNGYLKYATCSASCTNAANWTKTTVDNTGDVGKYTSIALDSDNKAYISYYDATNNAFKYATNVSGSWATETVEANGRGTKPHIDIYVNGEYKNCATTDSQFVSNDDGNDLFIGMIALSEGTVKANTCNRGFEGLCNDTRLEGAVDEVRFWTVARTQAEIQRCMNQELAVTGDCNIDITKLKGYWRFNEGEDKTANDLSGYGFSGTIMSPYNVDWTGGWTEGKSF